MRTREHKWLMNRMIKGTETNFTIHFYFIKYSNDFKSLKFTQWLAKTMDVYICNNFLFKKHANVILIYQEHNLC